MTSVQEQLTEAFDASFPKDLQRGLLEILYNEYALAHEDAKKQWPADLLKNIYPIMRRASIERDVRDLVKGFPTVQAIQDSNELANCSFTRVVAGRIFMTISAGDDPDSPVRQAKFRQSYAQLQADLFQAPQPVIPDAIYAILHHGPAALQPNVPAFARVIFPDGDLRSNAAYIDLMGRFPEIVAAKVMVGEEKIEPTFKTEIKPQEGKGKAEA